MKNNLEIELYSSPHTVWNPYLGYVVVIHHDHLLQIQLMFNIFHSKKSDSMGLNNQLPTTLIRRQY